MTSGPCAPRLQVRLNNRRPERKEHTVETTDYFDAHTIVDIRSGEEFMKLRTDRVSKRFESLFDETLVGTRHAEDGDRTREEPVDVFPFADVQVGPDCEFGQRITAVALEYGPAAVTVSLMAPFAELVTAIRPYTDGEADELV